MKQTKKMYRILSHLTGFGSCLPVVTAILAFTLLSGCSIRNYEKPEPAAAKESDFELNRSEKFEAAKPVADWWSNFNDPDLDTLMYDALRYNYDVEIAAANIRRTKALLREAGFNLYPVADVQGGYTFRVQSARNGLPIIDRGVEIYDFSVDANWQIDLFGRVSQAKEAAKSVYQATIAELNGVYVSVAAEVAATYIQLRGTQQRLRVARQNEEVQEETFKLTQQLVNSGMSPELDSLRARAQLEFTRSTIPPLKAQIKSAINRLSVLTGTAPGTLDEWLQEPAQLPSIPETVALGDAEDMIRRRPDVNRAERELSAAVAEFNVAASDYFPKIDIFGSVGYSAANIKDLGSSEALVGVVGPTISWSILDFGRVKARADAADAETERTLAAFNRTVLEALEDISSSMADFGEEEERRARLVEAANLSERAAELARERYQAGLTSFLDALEAESTLLEAQDQVVLSNMAVANDLVSIYTSLGGGWQVMSEAETPEEITGADQEKPEEIRAEN